MWREPLPYHDPTERTSAPRPPAGREVPRRAKRAALVTWGLVALAAMVTLLLVL